MKVYRKKVLAALLAVCLAPTIAIGQNHTGRLYTKEHPLVYEDAWDLWPYVYLNEHGTPEGYNVDLLKELFKDLDIPYVIKLKPTSEALEDLRAGRSDLMLRLEATFHDDYAHYGHEVVELFTHSVVSPKSSPSTIRTLADLSRQQVIVHAGSLSHRMMGDRGWEQNCLPFGDMKEAIQKVSSEEQGQILWNTLSLKWLMQKFQTANLQITPLDMPHGEYKFMSNDTVLLHRLDSAYARLCASDRIQPIQNKWFYPERADTGIPGWVAYVVAVAGLLTFLLLYYIITLHIRERRMTQLIAKHNRRLALILRTTKIKVWLYDIQRGTLRWMTENGEIENHEVTLDAFSHDYDETTFSQLTATLSQIAQGHSDSGVLELRSAGDDSREYITALSVFRRSRRGAPTVIVGMMDDQTERLLTRRNAKDNMLRYQSVFSTSMVDMTYYDPEGILTDINSKACQTLHCDRAEILAERVPFNYAIEDSEATVETFDGCFSTHIISARNNTQLARSIKADHDLYYEQQLVPVYDTRHNVLGIFGSARDVTEFVNSYRQLGLSISRLKAAAHDITEYISNINYALHMGGVRLANYSPSSHLLTIYREMNDVQLTLTQTRCLSLTDEASKRTAVKLLNNMDTRSGEPVDVDIRTIIRTKGQQRLSLQLHFIPIYDADGRVDNYFGLCRDISQEKATEEELEREKAKAQEVENVKNVFLRNMSYEIRTPIANVVGFAELFTEQHDPADEDNFIAEIKDNATYLLKLVNDILFLSRLDARMIEFNHAPIDFAYTFEGHCQMGWAKSLKPGVQCLLENPYEHLVVDIDDANVGHIIEQVAENAARFTDSGTIRARYDYIGDKLLITIDDTGRGISSDKQQRIFERFNGSGDRNGTGLGLAICKELAQQMGGAIHINTGAGRGTTVWIVIPCEATLTEKKTLS